MGGISGIENVGGFHHFGLFLTRDLILTSAIKLEETTEIKIN